MKPAILLPNFIQLYPADNHNSEEAEEAYKYMWEEYVKASGLFLMFLGDVIDE